MGTLDEVTIDISYDDDVTNKATAVLTYRPSETGQRVVTLRGSLRTDAGLVQFVNGAFDYASPQDELPL